jgi:GlpG protein
VIIMLGWLVLCFTGRVGPIANLAHLGGLIVGALAGWLAANWRPNRSLLK